jgi:MarR family transcriptional regulator, lower aerobic nicotinate degradation pathway regulator
VKTKSRARRRVPASAAGVREALDALRRIVQALRHPPATGGRQRLTSAQLFALQRLAEHPGLSLNELAALTFTHQSSVSVVVQRLVERGLVARVHASDDHRRLRLTVTREGGRVLHDAPPAIQDKLIAAMRALAPAKRRTLAEALGSLAQSVAPKDDRHPPMFFE